MLEMLLNHLKRAAESWQPLNITNHPVVTHGGLVYCRLTICNDTCFTLKYFQVLFLFLFFLFSCHYKVKLICHGHIFKGFSKNADESLSPFVFCSTDCSSLNEEIDSTSFYPGNVGSASQL